MTLRISRRRPNDGGAHNGGAHDDGTPRGAALAASLSLALLVAGAGVTGAASLSGCSAPQAPEEQPTQEGQGQGAPAEQIVEDAPAPAQEEPAEDPAPEPEPTPEEPDPPAPRALVDLASLDLDAIPAASELTTFSLGQAAAPELPAESRDAINAAIQGAQRYGSVSVVLLSCNTGVGIAYNTDTSVYGASSFKGPYVAYLCRELVETGQTSLDATCTVSEVDPFFSGAYGHLGATYSFRALAEATIKDSDNDAFRILHMNYDALGYYDWLDATFGAGTLPHIGYFPHVSARIMAKAWSYVLQYLQTGTETAAWLSGLYQNTGLSFIRNALEAAGTQATVYNKGGWYWGDASYNSTTDAGIVQIDGSTYLIAAVSDMSYGNQTASALESVIQSVFAARDVLG